MLVIGLTGGIGSGKSAVSKLFEQQGVVVVDTDKLSREFVAPGTPSFDAIVERFGVQILKKDGSLNRAKLREVIFSQKNNRIWLEELLHPLIRQEAINRVKAADSPYCILVIPLLVETDSQRFVDRVLVVDTPVDLQVKRVMRRDGMTIDQVSSILNTQAKRDQRLAVANDVIVNDKDFTYLEEQVTQLHGKYLGLLDN